MDLKQQSIRALIQKDKGYYLVEWDEDIESYWVPEDEIEEYEGTYFESGLSYMFQVGKKPY